MAEEKKFLDQAGVQYLWSKLSLEDYPNNQDLVAVINAIDETKADKDELVQSDWNQLDEQSLDFIKNKPFGEVLEKTKEIVWDGIITDDMEFVSMSADDTILYLVHLSNFTPTIEQLSNAEITMIMDNNSISEPIGEIENISNDIVSDTEGRLCVVYKDEAVFEEEGMVFPKAGLYCVRMDDLATEQQQYISKITFPTESKIKTIDPKYLPEELNSTFHNIFDSLIVIDNDINEINETKADKDELVQSDWNQIDE